MLVEEDIDRLEAGAFGGADLGYWNSKLLRQLQRIDVATALLHQIGHVQQNECWQAQREDRRGQHQLAGQVERIQNQEDGVGLGSARHIAMQDIHRNTSIF